MTVYICCLVALVLQLASITVNAEIHESPRGDILSLLFDEATPTRAGPFDSTHVANSQSGGSGSTPSVAIYGCLSSNCNASQQCFVGVEPMNTCISSSGASSVKVRCLNVTGAMCANVSFFNTSTCTLTPQVSIPVVCGKCDRDPFGGWGRVDGCDKGSSAIVYKYGCSSAACRNCTRTQVKSNSCSPMQGGSIFANLGGFTSCEHQVIMRTYTDGECRVPTASPIEVYPENKCVGLVSPGSRFIQCLWNGV